jgi:hypothetical protein
MASSPNDWSDFITSNDKPNNVYPITPPTPRNHNDNLNNLNLDAPTNAYVRKAIETECNQLAAMPTQSGRNHQLNKAAFNLRRFIDNGTCDEQTIFDALMDAAAACGVLAEDGDTVCANSIRSGFRGSQEKVGARPIPKLDSDNSQTIEVDIADFAAAITEPTPQTDHTTPDGALNNIFDANETAFWQTRPSLTTIYNAALARMCAPWAVLGHCAARALYNVRPTATLPPLIGGPGSLNWFGIIVAPSGGGKSAAADVARELIDTNLEQRSLGSGEGFIEAFIRPADKETGEPRGLHEAILFIADESDTVSALATRTGSTLLSVLRTAWTGSTLAFGYRGRNLERLDAHTYRATLMMAVQPARAGWILDDSGGGTPQRFNWFPGIDKRITLKAWNDTPIYPLTLPNWREWEYETRLEIPAEARDVILAARVANARGEQNALDGHALFCREKFAYALTVLDGRTEMNLEDWELSGVAAHVSTKTREWVLATSASDAYVEAEERGRLMGVAASASDDEKAHRAAGRQKRIGRQLMERLRADGPLKESVWRKGLNSRDRPWFPNVVDALKKAGLIELDEDRRWSVPAAEDTAKAADDA